MIAAVEIAIVLDNRNVAAGFPENAQRVIQPERRPRSFVKDLYRNPADILPHPLIKDCAQKRPVCLGGHRVLGHPCRRIGPAQHNREETDVGGADFLEIAVYPDWELDIERADSTQDVARNLEPPQELERAQRLFVARNSASVHPVAVMHFRRTVNAETHAESFVRQKPAPLLIQEDAVRLYPVRNPPPIGQMLPLKGNDFAEILQSKDRRLPTVPGESDHFPRGGIDVLI